MAETPKKYPMWDTIINYLDAAEKMFGGDKQEKAGKGIFQKSFLTIFSSFLRKLYEAEAQGIPKIMFNFCIPPELFRVFDRTYPICEEVGSVGLTVIGTQHIKYIELAEENGIAPEQCNAQKIWIGAMMANEIFKPDGIVYASQPCDSTNILYQVMQNWYKVPTYTLDVPYWAHDPDSEFYDERTVPYFVNQLKGFIVWAEKNFGLKFDSEHFRHMMELSNQAREAVLELNELMRAIPAPLPSLTSFNTYVALLTSAGTQAAADYCKFVRDEAANNAKQKISPLQERGKEEKFRVIWIYLPIFWDFMLFDWMERKFGAVSVMDLLGYNLAQPVDLSSKNKMFEGLARTTLDIPMGVQSRGPAEYYLDYLINVVKTYKADCAIYGGHLGCKHSWAIANLLKEELYEVTGVPTLIFEVDAMDNRPVTSRMIKAKLKTFFTEML
ncbi:MAG: 2-hydroxyacyl-CoA dehydratase [Candidatus Helarchaeota archaeon]|nr:2-hydroxyacyl-CoA dehydratase [Candidatus Helarchaeota archaeon]